MTLRRRVEQLEADAPERSHWADFWDAVELIYGDGKHLTAEERAECDNINPSDILRDYDAEIHEMFTKKDGQSSAGNDASENVAIHVAGADETQKLFGGMRR